MSPLTTAIWQLCQYDLCLSREKLRTFICKLVDETVGEI